VLGTLGSLVVAGIYVATGEDFWRALAFVGFFLNLFNLLPVLPLDGGRAMAAMAPWMWGVGFAALLALLIVAPNPILIIILLFGGMETWRRYKQRKAGLEGNAAYYKVKPIHRLAVGAVYVGLLVLLGVGMDLTHLARTFNDV
jgi:Zn-dependent protease